MIETHPKIEQMGGVKWTTAMTQEAARQTKLHQERMNKGLKLPTPLAKVSRLATEDCVWVFNVGPFEDSVLMGSWGTVRIQPCPAGVDYVPVLFNGGPVPGVYTEMIPGEGKYDGTDIDGDYIAQEIVGHGPLLRQYSGPDRRKIGVFAGSVHGPAGKVPLPEEVEAARDLVYQYLYELILEAKGAWGTGNENEFRMVAGSKHYLAAQLLMDDKRITVEDVPWFKEKLAPKKEELVPCENCGTPKNPKYPTCKECGHKDEALYELKFGGGKKAEPTPEEIEVRRLREENQALATRKGKQ